MNTSPDEMNNFCGKKSIEICHFRLEFNEIIFPLTSTQSYRSCLVYTTDYVDWLPYLFE